MHDNCEDHLLAIWLAGWDLGDDDDGGEDQGGEVEGKGERDQDQEDGMPLLSLATGTKNRKVARVPCSIPC